MLDPLPIWTDKTVETTTASGVIASGTLLGAVVDHKPFYQVGRRAVNTYFDCEIRHTDPNKHQWQTCLCQLTAQDEFEVVTVYTSSNTDNSAVTFDAGVKYVINDATAVAITEALRPLVIGDIPNLSSLYTTPSAVAALLADYATTSAVNASIAEALTDYSTTAEIDMLLANYSTPGSVATQIAGATILTSQLSGSLDYSRINGTGPFADNFIPSLNASKINAGIFGGARGGLGADASAFTGLLKMASGVASVATAETDYVTPSGAGTLANKTLTTPTIASLINALHDHTDTIGGGQLNASSVFSAGAVPVARGGTGASLAATGAATHFLRQASAGAVVTVGAIASADLTTALTTPPPYGATTPNTGKFSTVETTGRMGVFAAPSSSRSLYAYSGNLDAASGDYSAIEGQAATIPSSNNAGVVRGLNANTSLVGSGAINQTGRLVGVEAQAYANNSNAGATISDVRGFFATTYNLGANTISALYGIVMRYGAAGSGNIGSAYGAYIDSFRSSTGQATNLYGVYVNPVNTGLTLNYAIYTNAGLVRFGDDVSTTGALTATGTGRFGGLRIDQAPVAATPTPTHTITVNLNGTNYRIPCVI